MVLGVKTCSPHMCALAPLAKARHGLHGMAWFGRVCLCLIMYFFLSSWRSRCH